MLRGASKDSEHAVRREERARRAREARAGGSRVDTHPLTIPLLTFCASVPVSEMN